MENCACPLCDKNDFELLIQTSVMMMDKAKDEKMQFVQCKNCDFIYLNPRIPIKEIQKYYPDYYLSYQGSKAWGKYAWLADIGLKGELNKRINMVKKFIQKPKGRLLDLGCGKPDFLSLFQKKWDWEVKGIDFDRSSWDDEKYRGLDLTEGDISEMNLAELGNFDMITLWHYLEHDYSPRDTLQKLKELSHPETRLIIEVPNYDSLTRKRQKEYWQGFHTPRHTGVYTPETLNKMLSQNGWKVKKQYSYGSLDPFVLWWLGERDRKQLLWNISLESEFMGFMMQKAMYSPLFSLQKYLSLGVQTVVAVPA
jgi:2-polyprenyl-3-methyl-5-hydroxy-6-metoxy-1,4-benzoquinol methylase/rubredoxin